MSFAQQWLQDNPAVQEKKMLWVSSPFSLFDVGTHLGCKRFWSISGLCGVLLGLNKWEKNKFLVTQTIFLCHLKKLMTVNTVWVCRVIAVFVSVWAIPGLYLEEREQWIASLNFLHPPQIPRYQPYWLRKHRINIFDLSVYLSSVFYPALSHCTLHCSCFIFASLDFHLYSSVVWPFHNFKFMDFILCVWYSFK